MSVEWGGVRDCLEMEGQGVWGCVCVCVWSGVRFQGTGRERGGVDVRGGCVEEYSLGSLEGNGRMLGDDGVMG